jgi:hypothetical protein
MDTEAHTETVPVGVQEYTVQSRENGYGYVLKVTGSSGVLGRVQIYWRGGQTDVSDAYGNPVQPSEERRDVFESLDILVPGLGNAYRNV